MGAEMQQRSPRFLLPGQMSCTRVDSGRNKYIQGWPDPSVVVPMCCFVRSTPAAMKTTTILLLVLWPLATLGDFDGARPLQRRLQEKRAKYDARVNQWLRENPQHSFPPEDTTVEDLWERLQDADRQSARGFVSTDPDSPASETHLRPRKIATAQAMDEAETILNSAIFEAEKRAMVKFFHDAKVSWSSYM